MRELKFRVWDKVKEEFYYPLAGLHASYVVNENYVVQQYTGLKDLNGKEIYDGDIIKSTYIDCSPEGRMDYEEHIRVVEWDSHDLKWGIKNPKVKTWCYYEHLAFSLGSKVIGNIFENPELIK